MVPHRQLLINLPTELFMMKKKMLREKDAETYVKKYMKLALFQYKEEIPHTTKFVKLFDLICSMEPPMAILLRRGTRMLCIGAKLQRLNL